MLLFYCTCISAIFLGVLKMRKFLALILTLTLVFALSACNDKKTASNTDPNVSTSSETFVKPENYASVLLVSINPQFKLYLDESNNVLAVEPVNEDAKSFSRDIDFENKSIETVIGNIVEQANENGFIKENVTVNFEIVEQKDGINNGDILSKAVSAANKKATELKIEIKAKIKESHNSQTTETNSENTQTEENSKPTTSSKTQETTKKEESTSKPITTTKPTESSKPTHTHNFSAATCTSPQKCSCGVTEGTALGHKWSEATCKSPKTCSVCKKTEGNLTSHIYEGVYCVNCNMPLDAISKSSWICIKKQSGNYYFACINFNTKEIVDGSCCPINEAMSNNYAYDYSFIIDNTEYVVTGTNVIGTLDRISETAETLTVDPYGFNECFIHFTRLNKNELIVSKIDDECSEFSTFTKNTILNIAKLNALE